MTATKRSEVLARILTHSGVDALPAIRLYLEAHPATYEQLLDGALVARAWDDHFPRSGGAYHTRTRYDARAGGRRLGYAAQAAVGGRWLAYVHEDQIPGAWDAPEGAQRAVDARLRGHDVVLVGVTP